MCSASQLTVNEKFHMHLRTQCVLASLYLQFCIILKFFSGQTFTVFPQFLPKTKACNFEIFQSQGFECLKIRNLKHKY